MKRAPEFSFPKKVLKICYDHNSGEFPLLEVCDTLLKCFINKSYIYQAFRFLIPHYHHNYKYMHKSVCLINLFFMHKNFGIIFRSLKTVLFICSSVLFSETFFLAFSDNSQY